MKTTFKVAALLMSAVALAHPKCSIAQDYMEDLRGEGNPISFGAASGNVLFRLNTSDESIKFGFFRVHHLKYRDETQKATTFDLTDAVCAEALRKIKELLLAGTQVAPGSYAACTAAGVTTASFMDIGWGFYAKAKSNDGIGEVFSSGKVAMGTRVSAYALLRNTRIEDDYFKRSWMVIPSVAWQENAYSLATTSPTGAYQFNDTSLGAWDFGVSALYKFYIGNTDKAVRRLKSTEFFIGLSFTQAQPNDYGDLSRVSISQTSTRVDTVNGNPVTTVTQVKDKTTYAVGTVKQFSESRVRLNIALVPAAFERRMAFNLYPSFNFREGTDMRFDIGLSANLLEKGDRLLSIGGVTMELADVNNTANSTDPFWKRTFRFGVNAGLNIDGIISKKN